MSVGDKTNIDLLIDTPDGQMVIGQGQITEIREGEFQAFLVFGDTHRLVAMPSGNVNDLDITIISNGEPKKVIAKVDEEG